MFATVHLVQTWVGRRRRTVVCRTFLTNMMPLVPFFFHQHSTGGALRFCETGWGVMSSGWSTRGTASPRTASPTRKGELHRSLDTRYLRCCCSCAGCCFLGRCCYLLLVAVGGDAVGVAVLAVECTRWFRRLFLVSLVLLLLPLLLLLLPSVWLLFRCCLSCEWDID